jgi:hypothetical protein
MCCGVLAYYQQGYRLAKRFFLLLAGKPVRARQLIFVCVEAGASLSFDLLWNHGGLPIKAQMFPKSPDVLSRPNSNAPDHL